MPPLPQASGAAFAERAQQLLKDAAELTSGRDPSLIRDLEPQSAFEAIPLAAARQGCRRYADNPELYSGRRQARVERACRPYLDDIGYGTPPDIRKPFEGGQCPGTFYTATLRFYNITTGAVTGDATFDGFGPVGIRAGGNQQPSPGSPTPPGTTYQPGRELTFNGVPRVSWDGAFGIRPGAEVLSIVPRSGEPDNCGDPPPDVRGPVPPSNPGPVREPFNPSPDINIDIDVEINPDGTINVDFGTGPVTIDPFGDEPSGGGGGGGIGDPGTPEETGPAGGAEGEAPEGQILTGLRINFVSPPVGGNEYAPGVYRGVCYVYMGTADGLDHDPAGAMLRDGQFVYAEKDFLTRWSVSANRGYNLRVTPYYRPAEAEG